MCVVCIQSLPFYLLIFVCPLNFFLFLAEILFFIISWKRKRRREEMEQWSSSVWKILLQNHKILIPFLFYSHLVSSRKPGTTEAGSTQAINYIFQKIELPVQCTFEGRKERRRTVGLASKQNNMFQTLLPGRCSTRSILSEPDLYQMKDDGRRRREKEEKKNRRRSKGRLVSRNQILFYFLFFCAVCHVCSSNEV